jgi:PIN domain nuclease of toxin-antitoxin system
VILLDTHTLLWWLADDRLDGAARQAIADRRQRVGVSAVTLFEVETKRRLGKLRAPQDLIGAVEAEGFELVSLDARAAAMAGSMPWDHRDPFDRLLVAQSRLGGWPLLTADDRVLQFEPTAIAAG